MQTMRISHDVVTALAEAEGVCVRPVLRRVTDRAAGNATTVPIPCGSTREGVCRPCAIQARRLRMHQCSEGWHLAADPVSDDPELNGRSAELVDDLTDPVEPDTVVPEVAQPGDRRTRSTRRRSDAADLLRVPMAERTTGPTFTDERTGEVFRPSMFVTLTLSSYGRVVPGTGIPADPTRYDYRRAALDALHFAKLVDRTWQNLRRCAGYKVQYFSAVEAQRRLAPHLHAAIRGAIPRQVIKAVAKASYHQLWWPPFEQVRYESSLPVWDHATGRYVDPDTGESLPTWAEALDRIDADPDAQPAHVTRWGRQVDIKGLLGGTPDSDRAVRYLCKYLTKAVSQTYADPETEAANPTAASYEAHIDRLHAEVRWLPCSPICSNWLRFGTEPAEPGPGLIPGMCSSKAHDRENLGLGGRRVLVSRHWSGKTLSQHRADRSAVVRAALEAAGIDPLQARRCAADVLDRDGLPRYVWEEVPAQDRDYTSAIVASIRQARTWRDQYERAKVHAASTGPPVDSRSAVEKPAVHGAA